MATSTGAPSPARRGPDGRTSRRVGIAMALTAFVGLAFANLLVASPGLETSPPGSLLALILVAGAFVIAGVAAWERRPTNRTGPYMTVAGVALAASGLLGTEPPIVSILVVPALPIAIALIVDILLAFPTGRLASGLDRLFVIAIAGLSLVDRIGALLLVTTLEGPDGPRPNALRIVESPGTYPLVNALLSLGFLACSVGLVWRIAHKWRALVGPARRSVVPILLGGLVFLVASGAYVILLLIPSTTAVAARWQFLQVASLAAVPIGLAVGLLRVHLARLSVVDRVVRLGDVPPGRLRASLATALDDPTIRLLRWDDATRGYVDEDGLPVGMPTPDSRTAVTVLETDGAPTAALLHDPALLEDPGLVAAVAAALRLTVENQRLQGEVERQLDEVRASRVRIVEAADAERRAVERDLHDGAQQRLVSIDLSLQLLRAHTAEMDHSSIDASIERASDELRTAIKELRLLTHGVHPALLRDAGIGPALQSLADRSGLPVVLTADVPNRLSPVVEATVYFVASESLANAAKHAQASVAHVAVGVDGSTIVVDVRDDGRGGADPSAGSGLRGLQDRVAALGGSLRVESPVGGGTTVRASVPFA